jgi:hypothetical protein
VDTTPVIDYTNKDYASLRQALLDLAHYRLPDWTDQSPADLGMLMVDLFAYMGDIILYYQDRIANESFLPTAVERRSVLNALRLIGYELTPPVPAAAELTVFFKPPPAGSSTVVTIPQGALFASTPSPGAQLFSYLGPDLDIDLASDQVSPTGTGKLTYVGLPVSQSRPQSPTVIGSSTGEPNQMFAIPLAPVVLETLVVEVDEGAGWARWDRRQSLLYDTAADGSVSLSSATAPDYYVQFDENDVCWVSFGDGTYGRRPAVGTNNIRATFSVGGDAAGNVLANTITVAKTTIPLFDSVTNPQPAAGGADHEDVAHAVRFGPMAFRAGQRAVTLADYVALAQQAGGVAKVRAAAPNWNVIELYVAPVGDTLAPVPESLRRQLLAYFEDKRMAGTFVEILNASPVPIDIGIEVVNDKRYRPDAVRQVVSSAVQDLLAFANVDFAQPLYLSDVYGKIEKLPGVTAVTVTQFRRADAVSTLTPSQVQQLLAPLGSQATPDLTATLQRAFQIDVAADGRIAIQDYEIPVLGNFVITLTEASR